MNGQLLTKTLNKSPVRTYAKRLIRPDGEKNVLEKGVNLGVNRMREGFVSMISHELRTPLTSILGFSDFLLSQGASDQLNQDEQIEYLTHIYSNARALESIVNDFIDLYRFFSGHEVVLSRTNFSIGDIIRGVLGGFSDGLGRCHFEVEFPEQPIVVFGDKELIKRALESLIDNSIKFSPQGGRIKVGCRRVGNHVRVSVEDEGLGMSQEQMLHAFDPFYRADPSDTAVGGRGVGLSLAKLFMEAHGGRIWLKGEIGLGTKAALEIPLNLHDLYDSNAENWKFFV